MTPIALVTGAGSGIGAAIAHALSADHHLVLVGRRREPLAALAQTLGLRTTVMPADVSDPAAARQLIADAIASLGSLDVLINNAGVAPLKPIDQHTPALIAEAFATNAIGPANTIAAAWPHFVSRRAGVIVNVTSLAGLDPFPGFFAYGAAKAAANLLIKSCHNEGKARGIRAYAVAPGAVETSMLRSMFSTKQIPASAALAPEAVAAVVRECVVGTRPPTGEPIVVKA